MTQISYTNKKGGTKNDVALLAGSSIGTSAVQVNIDSANVSSKTEVLRAIETVRERIIQGVWPPGAGAVLRSLIVVSADTSAPGDGSTNGYYTTAAANERTDTNMVVTLIGPGSGPVGPLTFAFPAFYIDAATGYSTAPTFTLEAAVLVGGVNYNLSVGGVNTVTTPYAMNAATAPMVFTDPITIPGLTYPVQIKVRTGCVVATSGTKQPTTKVRVAANGEQVIRSGTVSQVGLTTDMTTGLAGTGGVAAAAMYGPSAVLSPQSSQSQQAIGFVGCDSIIAGAIANDADSYGNMGYAKRAARALNKPFASMARGSNRAMWSTTSVISGSQAATGVHSLDAYFSLIVGNASTNDFQSGQTLANLQAWKVNDWAAKKAAGAKVGEIKCIQRTDTSNVPLSTAFDPAGTNLRGLYNAWLDTMLANGTIDYLYNPSPLLENGSTGTWQNYAAMTGDGTHPNSATDSGTIQPDFQAFLAAIH